MMGLGLGLGFGLRGIEEVLCELKEDINEQGLPPGFRFHPTDEELVTFYLASQVFNNNNNNNNSSNSLFPTIKIAQLDLNRCEPWDLPDVAKMGEREWYFFSLKDRKYPTGLRTNRATEAGYWKATGKDREVYTTSSSNVLVGMKKTLVFYKGRAPRGEKTRWVMHEYRLDGQFSSRNTCKEEWVICRIFHKIKDKKSPIFQGQHMPCYFLGSSSSTPPITSNIFPSLLELEPDPIQKANLQSNLFPNINSSSTINTLQLPPHSPNYMTHTSNKKGSKPNNNNSSPSPSNVLIKSFLSQVHSMEEEDPNSTAITIPKQCKTGSNFSPCPTRPHPILGWAEQQPPDFSGLDFTALGFSFGPTDHSLPLGISTSFDFNGAFGSAVGASWPLD